MDAPPAATLVLLHGHDDEPAAIDIEAFAPTTAWTVVAPPGPVVTGGERRAWWRTGDDGAPVADDVRAAVAIVDEVVRLHSAGPVVLGGFSQGGALALALAVGRDAPGGADAPLAGAFAIGAWLPDLPGIDLDVAAAAARATPVLIAHGTDDEHIDLLLGRSAARLLSRAGVPVTFVQLDVGHTLGPFVANLVVWADRAVRGEQPSDPP